MDFSANITEGFAPLSVQFTDSSENATSVTWDFGDGSNSGDRNPVHEFTTQGIYTVNLTASNENGTASKLATITVSEKPLPVLPVASLGINTTKGSAPLSVQFNDRPSKQPEGFGTSAMELPLPMQIQATPMLLQGHLLLT